MFYIKIKTYFKIFLKKILFFFVRIFKFFIKKKNYIIIQSYNPYSYSENTRYLFEYMSRNSSGEFKIFWNTRSKIISEYLKTKNLNYINILENPVKFMYVYLSCKILVDCGTKYLNFLGIAAKDKKIIKISLYHGGGPKTMPISKFLSLARKKDIDDHNSFNFINFSSKFLTKKCEDNFNIESAKTLSLGFPRCDQFFLKKNKKIFKYLTGKNLFKSKIILYSPTWRGYDYQFPLNFMEGINYFEFNNFLNKNNLFFFYSCHPNQVDKNIPLNYNRIKFIDIKKYPFYDTNLFLNEVDMLINDYSASSTDFALLKRPQAFFMPDYNRYLNYQGFLENYKRNLIGPEIKNFKQFKKIIINYCFKPKNYNNDFKFKLKKYLDKYYDTKIKNSSELLKKFIVSQL